MEKDDLDAIDYESNELEETKRPNEGDRKKNGLKRD